MPSGFGEPDQSLFWCVISDVYFYVSIKLISEGPLKFTFRFVLDTDIEKI